MEMRPELPGLAIAVGLMCACASVVVTASEPKPADRLAAMKKEAKEAEEELSKQSAKLGESNEDRAKEERLYKAYAYRLAKLSEAAVDIAKADPKSNVAFDAVEWVLTETPWFDQPVGKAALELARDHHAASPKIGKVVLAVGRFAPPGEEANGKAVADLMSAVGRSNKDRAVRGRVAMVAAWRAKEKADAADAKKQKDADELASAAEKAFEAVAREFGECELPGRGEKQTVADACKVELFELRNLRVGKTAPDIEGEDTDGVKFKLSDYRGKVVLLDFWADW